MGTTTAKYQSNNLANPAPSVEWQLDHSFHPLQVFASVNPPGHYKVLSFVELPPEQYKHEIQIYNQRLAHSILCSNSKNPKPVCNLYSFSPVSSSCCSGGHALRVEVEYCAKLHCFSSFSQADSVYLLLSLLYGYGQLHRLTQAYIHVTEDTVGINMQGEVKVWSCQNFALNSPGIILADSQALIVKRIVTLVLSNSEKYRLPNELITALKRLGNKPTFAETVVLVKYFARANSFRIPERMESVDVRQSIVDAKIKPRRLSENPVENIRKQELKNCQIPIKSIRQSYDLLQPQLLTGLKIKTQFSASMPYQHAFVSNHVRESIQTKPGSLVPFPPSSGIQDKNFTTPVKGPTSNHVWPTPSTAAEMSRHKKSEREKTQESIIVYEPQQYDRFWHLRNLARSSQKRQAT